MGAVRGKGPSHGTPAARKSRDVRAFRSVVMVTLGGKVRWQRLCRVVEAVSGDVRGWGLPRGQAFRNACAARDAFPRQMRPLPATRDAHGMRNTIASNDAGAARNVIPAILERRVQRRGSIGRSQSFTESFYSRLIV